MKSLEELLKQYAEEREELERKALALQVERDRVVQAQEANKNRLGRVKCYIDYLKDIMKEEVAKT